MMYLTFSKKYDFFINTWQYLLFKKNIFTIYITKNNIQIFFQDLLKVY